MTTQDIGPTFTAAVHNDGDLIIQRARIASSPHANPVDWDAFEEWEAAITVACDAAQYFAHAAFDREVAAVHTGRRLPPPLVALDETAQAHLDAFNAAHDAEETP